jgi:hypothetical protein
MPTATVEQVRARTDRRVVARQLGVAAVVVAIVATGVVLNTGTQTAHAQERVFATESPWNAPIAADAELDERRPAMARYLAGAVPVADLYEFGVPVWEADETTPTYRVRCTEPWGRCPFRGQRVPIPDEATPSEGSDGAMVVVDAGAGKAYEFWRAKKRGGRWTTAWGAVSRLGGDGRRAEATGSGISRLAGVVRLHEIAAGRIDHALVFSTDNACRNTLRFPASQTDGHSRRKSCIPHGTRIRLDPAVDLDAIPELTPAERAVADALQTYGAYSIDNGGAPVAFIFEAPNGRPDPYPAAGFEFDYAALEHIPWDRLQVIAAKDRDGPHVEDR